MHTAMLDDDHDDAHGAPYGGDDSGVHVRHLRCGDRIAARYAIHGVLGQGGFAMVYDAEHIALGKRVAIKVLHLDGDTPLALVERFRREARISAIVHHTNVLEVFDTGTLEDGSPYLVMERINGETLFERISRGTLSVAAVVEIGRDLLTALKVLAEHGIVHRDVKPENLMLHDPGDGLQVVKVVDFGISRRVVPELEVRLTSHGALVGTPSYMSPEQLRGEDVDARTDLYSAGVVLYEALTGHVPHERPSFSELVLAALHDKVRPVRQLRAGCPAELERIVMKALARRRDDRYQTAEAMLRDLLLFAAGGKSREASASATPTRAQGARRTTGIHEAWVGMCAQVPSAARALPWLLLLGVLGLSTTSARPVNGALARLLANGVSQGEKPERIVAPPSPKVLPADAPAAVLVRTEPLVERPEPTLLRLTRPPVESLSGPSRSAGDKRAHGHALDTDRRRTAAQGARRENDAARREQGRVGPLGAREPQQVLAMQVGDRKAAERVLEDALAAHARGRYTEAQLMYRRAVRLLPYEASAWRGLGLVAARRGASEEAREALEHYLTLSPHGDDARKIRARIKALP